MTRYRALLVVILAFVFAASANNLSAQSNYLTDTGTPVYGTQLNAVLGTVNASNGNVHIDLPLTSTVQRGKLSGNIHLVYDSRIWQVVDSGGSSYSWQPLNVPMRAFNGAALQGGWTFQIGDAGTVQYDQGAIPCYFSIHNFRYIDSTNTTHTFSLETLRHFPSCGSDPDYPTAVGFANDGSGYQAAVSQFSTMVVYDPRGNQVYPTPTDTNGNYLTISPSTGVYTDTVGTTSYFTQVTNNTQTIPCSTPAGLYYCTVTYESIPVHTLFAQANVTEYYGNITVIASLMLPDGTGYTFHYDAGSGPGRYGELTSVTLPTGGTVQYGYSRFIDSYYNANHWVTSVVADGGTTTYSPSVMTYCTSNGSTTDSGCQEQVVVDSPAHNDTVYTMTLNNGAWNTAVSKYNGTVSSGGLIKTKVSTQTFTKVSAGSGCTITAFNPCSQTFLSKDVTVTTLSDTNQQTSTETDFTPNNESSPAWGDVSSTAIYDFSTGSQASQPLMQMQKTYNFLGGAGTGIPASLLAKESILDGLGNSFSYKSYSYDSNPQVQQTSGLPQHYHLSTPGGNLTQITNGVGFTAITYDDAGTVLSVTDANGSGSTNTTKHTTTYGYDSTDTFLTLVTRPTTVGSAHVSASQYNSVYHYLEKTDDENSVANGSMFSTRYAYYPNDGSIQSGKLHTVTAPDGGVTTFVYQNSNTTVISTLQNAAPGASSVTTTTVDSYGRDSTITVNGVTSTNTYDSSGRLYCTTTPATPGSVSATDGSDCVTTRDGMDRPTLITHTSDGTTQSMAYTGNSVTVTDETQRMKKYVYDAVGRLTQVWEPDNTGALNWETDYSYTPGGQMASAVQKGGLGDSTQWRTRTWSYDGVGRLQQEVTPEAGLVCYGNVSSGVCQSDYDPNGNLNHLTTANGVTTFAYDRLNRLISKSIAGVNGQTINQNLTYDTALPGFPFTPTNGVGQLTVSTEAGGGAHAYGYDAMGRVTQQVNCPSSTTGCSPASGLVTAQYDLAGNPISITYPSGRTVSTTYDLNNRQTSVQYIAWAGQALPTPVNYWSNGSYFPPGELKSAQYGQNIQVASVFDGRQSLTHRTYSVAAATISDKQYVWDTSTRDLLRIKDVIGNTQRKLLYDNVHRLLTAQDVVVSSTPISGTAIVGGHEQSHRNCGGPDPLGTQASPPSGFGGRGGSPVGQQNCTTTYDTGTVYLTVGSYTASANYEQGSSQASIAADLAAGINNSGVITAQPNGNTITLFAATPMSLAGSSSSDFVVSVSGTSLAGGEMDTPVSGGMNVAYYPDPFGNVPPANTSTIFPPTNQTPGYSYTASGELSSDAVSHGFTYDALGRMLTGSNMGNATLAYDVDGKRARKIDSAGTTAYAYFGELPISVLTPQGTWSDFIYAGGERIAEVDGTQSAAEQYRLSDHLGSLAILTDVSGSTLGVNDYYPYGTLFSSNSNNNYTFTSLEHDTDTDTSTGLYRDLLSSTNRFIEPDPYRGSYDWSDPQSLNRYAYASNSPATLIDRSGLDDGGGNCGFLCSIFGGVAIGIGLGTDSPLPYVAIKGRPQGQIWNEHGSYQIHPYTSIADVLGVSTAGCEFGACGSSFGVPGCPACEDKDTTISGVVNVKVGFEAFWGGLKYAAKGTGCVVIGGVKGTQSFFGLKSFGKDKPTGLPDGYVNGPPGNSQVIREARTALTLWGPTIMNRLLRSGPVGRVAADAIPVVGTGLLYAQTALAVNDGVKAGYECLSKVQ